jgi:hypothetical protein
LFGVFARAARGYAIESFEFIKQLRREEEKEKEIKGHQLLLDEIAMLVKQARDASDEDTEDDEDDDPESKVAYCLAVCCCVELSKRVGNIFC